MDINLFKHILNFSWTKETCVPSLRDKWTNSNKCLGQCAITVINDYYGGKIMRCMTSSGSHYYNLIDDKIVDLTVSQFQGAIPQYEEGSERTREYLLSNEDTKKRYLMLLKNVSDTLKNRIIIDSIEIEKIIEDIKVRRKHVNDIKSGSDLNDNYKTNN